MYVGTRRSFPVMYGFYALLRERLGGRRVGVLVCGSNIDLATFWRLVGDGKGAG